MLRCPQCRQSYEGDLVDCPDDGMALLPDEAFVLASKRLEPGDMAGEYCVTGRLGSGSFGDVYAGEHPLIGKRVAIKVLHRKFASDPEVVSRFMAEARAVNRIRHHNIIDIFAFGVLEEQQQHYFVMELLEGLTLEDLLQKQGVLDVALTVSIARGIADGLDAAHEAGVTHRDLKPENIYLAERKGGGYFPKLLDFGVAKLLGDDVAHKTATGLAIGTPAYMSPEQCRGKAAGPTCDVYALGCVVHEMLTGKILFSGETAMDVMTAHSTKPPPPMSSVRPELPSELDAPVLAMLAKKAKRRPASAGAAVAALATAAARGGAVEAAASDQAARNEVGQRDGTSGEANEFESARTARVSSRDVATSDEAGPRRETRSAGLTGSDGATSAVGGELAEPVQVARAATLEGVQAVVPKHLSPRRWMVGALAVGAIGGLGYWAVGGGTSRGSEAAEMRPNDSTRAPAVSATALASASASNAGLSAEITVRLDVQPRDARVTVDDGPGASAATPVTLPRSADHHAIRIDKEGYESQTLWVTADRDRQLPRIVLTAVAVPSSTVPSSTVPSSTVPSSTVPSSTPVVRSTPENTPGPAATVPKKLNKQLERPPILGK